MELRVYVLFSVANRNTRAKVIVIASIYVVNMFNKLRNIVAIIALANIIDNLYINKDSNNSRIRSFYLFKFEIDITN